jgi:hypothetical protein
MWRALSKKRWQVWAEGWVQVWVQVWVQGRIERLEEVMAPCWSLGRREERGEAWLEEGRRGGRRGGGGSTSGSRGGYCCACESRCSFKEDEGAQEEAEKVHKRA